MLALTSDRFHYLVMQMMIPPLSISEAAFPLLEALEGPNFKTCESASLRIGVSRPLRTICHQPERNTRCPSTAVHLSVYY